MSILQWVSTHLPNWFVESIQKLETSFIQVICEMDEYLIVEELLFNHEFLIKEQTSDFILAHRGSCGISIRFGVFNEKRDMYIGRGKYWIRQPYTIKQLTYESLPISMLDPPRNDE